MIYQQTMDFDLPKNELYNRLLVYFMINNYRIRRSGDDTIIAENPLPFTLHRHPLRLISFWEITLSEQNNHTVLHLKADYDHLRRFVRRMFRLAFFVAVLPVLFLIIKIALMLKDSDVTGFEIWGILLVNVLIGLSILGLVWVFSKKKFTGLQKMMVFGSGENPELHRKICSYFKELFE